jgi:SAM-dependent methyltransferase
MTRTPRLGLRAAVARWLMLRAQETASGGVGGYSVQAFAGREDPRPFPQAESEAEDFERFFSWITGFPAREALEDREVLDFGSGYGGRTVQYRRQCRARRVCGVEPHENMVKLSREYASYRGIDGVEFTVCGHRGIPYPDESFDVVISYDVLEHVEHPPSSVAEIWRVLRPGGLSLNVFPVYFGARSHHLDYIVRMQGIHWLFSPRTLVSAVNSILATDPRFGTALQPAPGRSFDGARDVLPYLNGLSSWHLPVLFDRFETVQVQRHPLQSPSPRVMRATRALAANPVLPLTVRDAMTLTMSAIYRKPAH